MTVVVGERADLTLDAFARVAAGGESVVIGEPARSAMDRARASLLRQQALPAASSRAPVWDPGFGPPHLPERVVRGLVFARLADLVEGHAGCRPEVADRLVSLLDGRLSHIPAASATAGEILVLAQLVTALGPFELQAGEREALGDGPLLASALGPFELQAGEREALVDGSPFSTALVADVALQARQRLGLAVAVFALSVEAMRAPLDAYHPALADLWGDRFQEEALGALGAWLGAPSGDRRPFQAPVSFRVLPRVLGQAFRAVDGAEQVAGRALGSVTLEHAFLPPGPGRPDGLLLECGGSYAAATYPAIDTLSATWADLCTLADRHTTKLHRTETSLLPDGLAPDGDAPGGGPWAGTAVLGSVQVGLGEAARHAAARTMLPESEGGAYGRREHDMVLPTFVAYERHVAATASLDMSLAVLAVSAARALALAGRDVPGTLGVVLDLVHELAPPLGRRQEVPRRREGTQPQTSGGARAQPAAPDEGGAPLVASGGVSRLAASFSDMIVQRRAPRPHGDREQEPQPSRREATP